jgi:hypothetical protein
MTLCLHRHHAAVTGYRCASQHQKKPKAPPLQAVFDDDAPLARKEADQQQVGGTTPCFRVGMHVKIHGCVVWVKVSGHGLAQHLLLPKHAVEPP